MSNAASTTEARPSRDWLVHVILILGVVVFALPLWIVLMGSTHDAATIGRGDIPLLPGPDAVANYTLAWTRGEHRVTATVTPLPDLPADAVVRGRLVLDLPATPLSSTDPVCADPYSTKRFVGEPREFP